MPIESVSRKNFQTKRLLKSNYYLIQLNDSGLIFYPILPRKQAFVSLTVILYLRCYIIIFDCFWQLCESSTAMVELLLNCGVVVKSIQTNDEGIYENIFFTERPCRFYVDVHKLLWWQVNN